jgi:hypothetical protein
MAGPWGLIAMAARMALVTVRWADPEINPEDAVKLALPLLTPVASPLELIEAIEEADELQVAELVRFCVLPSL